MKNSYHGRCHFWGHPGELTLEEIKEKQCGAKGCYYFEEYPQLSRRWQLNQKQKEERRKITLKRNREKAG